MIQAANQVNQHMVVIKKDIIPNVIASIREEYIKECEYMYENNLQYVDDEFDEREFLTLFFGQYPNTVDYWYSKLSGELDLYNPLVIEYVQAIFKHEKDIVERLEHLKKVLNLKESIDNVNDLVNRLPKAGKTVKYKPNCYVIRNEGVENRCIIGDINKSYIDKIRDNRIEKVERVSFNKIYMEVLLEEMGMQGLKTSDDNKGVFTKNLFMDEEVKFISLILNGYIKTEYVYKSVLNYALQNKGKTYFKYIFEKAYDKITEQLRELECQGYTFYKLSNFYVDVYKSN